MGTRGMKREMPRPVEYPEKETVTMRCDQYCGRNTLGCAWWVICNALPLKGKTFGLSPYRYVALCDFTLTESFLSPHISKTPLRSSDVSYWYRGIRKNETYRHCKVKDVSDTNTS